MEQLMIDLVGKYAIVLIPILLGFLASFAIEAMLHYTPEWLTLKYVILIFSVLEAVPVFFAFPHILTSLVDEIEIFFTTVFFSITFYYAFGRTFVQFVLKKVTEKAENKIQ